MARYNPDSMQIDDGEFAPKLPRVSTEPATPMSDAEIKAASIAAARELAMTPYTELSAAERKAMTPAE